MRYFSLKNFGQRNIIRIIFAAGSLFSSISDIFPELGIQPWGTKVSRCFNKNAAVSILPALQAQSSLVVVPTSATRLAALSQASLHLCAHINTYRIATSSPSPITTYKAGRKGKVYSLLLWVENQIYQFTKVTYLVGKLPIFVIIVIAWAVSQFCDFFRHVIQHLRYRVAVYWKLGPKIPYTGNCLLK